MGKKYKCKLKLNKTTCTYWPDFKATCPKECPNSIVTIDLVEEITADRDRWKALAELAVELTYKCYPHVNDYYIKKHGYDVDYWNMVKMRKEMEAE